MVPFWGKQLLVRVGLLAGLSLVLLVVVWSISQGSGQSGNGPAQAKLNSARPAGDSSEPAKPPKQSQPSAPVAETVPAKSPIAGTAGDQPPKPAPPAAEIADPKPAPEVRLNPPMPEAKPDNPPRPNPPVAEVKPDKPNPPAAEMNGDKPKGKEVRGIIRTLDAQKRTVTLRVGEKRETAYRLANDARISGGANNMTLRDIKPGSRVRAVLGEGDTIVELALDKGRERPREDDRKKPGKRAKDD